MHQFFVGPGTAFAHDAVAMFALAHGLTMVRSDDDHGLIPQPLIADGVQQHTDAAVYKFDIFSIQGAYMLAFFISDAPFYWSPGRQQDGVALPFGVVGARFFFPD